MSKISGRQIDLSDGRHVFYAEHDKVHYFRFMSREAHETKLKLSDDANDALIQLLTAKNRPARWIVNLGDGNERDATTWKKLDAGPPLDSIA